tara:strand:+ start:299 stop:862 length:564 start_codon:yes stop_codon:yes gene_type:complete
MTDKSKATGKLKAELQNDGTKQAMSVDSSSDSDLETVRDILFGAQVRNAEKQRDALAKQFTAMIADLSKNTDDQFENLKNDIQKIRQEQDENSEQSARKLNEKIDALDLSLASLDKATSSAEADLADQIDTSVTTLNAQMESWKEELFSQLDQVQQHLTHDKTDRGALADMFSLMSEQLMKDSVPKK